MSTQKLLELVKHAKGFHRPNLFRVEITLPEALGFGTERLDLSAYSAPIPGYSISSEVNITGGIQPIHIATGKAFAPLPIGFRISADFHEHELFEQWRNLIAPNGAIVGYYDDYVADIRVIPVSRNNKTLKEFHLVDCKPETVGDVDQSYDVTDTVATTTVSFTYRDFSIEG